MMSKKSKIIILITFIAIFTILLFNSNFIYAEVNPDYSGVDSVPQEGLEKAANDSTIIKLLAKLVFAVGRMLEWLLGTIFKLLTGYTSFPWADKIVFNAVPLLDINFMNPHGESFVSNIKGVLEGIYSTILTLAGGFFGIAVLITSIKLVISSIAAEKAKYKKAVIDWLVGFVMLFCIHYFISFVFYLNEQLVIVASNIVTGRLDTADGIAQAKANKLVTELIKKAEQSGVEYGGEKVFTILERNKNILATWIKLDSDEDFWDNPSFEGGNNSHGAQDAFMKTTWNILWVEWDASESNKKIIKTLGIVMKWAESENISVPQLEEVRNNVKFAVGAKTGVLGVLPGDFWDMIFGIGFVVNGVESGQAIETTEMQKLFINKDGEFDRELYNDFVGALDNVAFWNKTYRGIEDKENSNLIALEDLQTEYYVNDYNHIEEGYYLVSSGAQLDRAVGADDLDFAKRKGVDKKIHGLLTLNREVQPTSFYYEDLFNDLIKLKNASPTRTGTYIEGDAHVSRIISDLASYFRDNAYGGYSLRSTNISAAKYDKSKINVQNMIMYAVLVAQSLILFIAYIKRLFYVIILAMLAPVVVVVDFFQKFGK